jgi:cation transport ATPase
VLFFCPRIVYRLRRLAVPDTASSPSWRKRQPGMMTLIAVAITAAYVFSAAVTFGFPGMSFYWELVTLIAIMLLGHWIEMRSVMGASRALEELVRLLARQRDTGLTKTARHPSRLRSPSRICMRETAYWSSPAPRYPPTA